jgi:hypothetical protein
MIRSGEPLNIHHRGTCRSLGDQIRQHARWLLLTSLRTLHHRRVFELPMQGSWASTYLEDTHYLWSKISHKVTKTAHRESTVAALAPSDARGVQG